MSGSYVTPEGDETKLRGWKQIAGALDVCRETAMKWAKLGPDNADPLPVRVDHLGVYAFPSAVSSWASRRDMALTVAEEIRELRAEVVNLRRRASTSAGATARK